MKPKHIDAGMLDVAYLEYGNSDGWPCVLAHGFPYDVHTYAESAPILADKGARVIVPWLRGYGPTRFLDSKTPRSGQQAALGSDLLALLDALELPSAVVGGYDWGGRAACIVSALWPDRVDALVTGNSYNIQNIAVSMSPASAEQEAAFWYQYYFHSERGYRGLTENRSGIAKLLWKMWSPPWNFSDDVFEQSAGAFENPDFVDVVIHSYRHRYGLVDGDPALETIEEKLARQPAISVPTIRIDGDSNGVHGSTLNHADRFIGPAEHRVFAQAGHNLPQEKPVEWAQAVLDARNLGR